MKRCNKLLFKKVGHFNFRNHHDTIETDNFDQKDIQKTFVEITIGVCFGLVNIKFTA